MLKYLILQKKLFRTFSITVKIIGIIAVLQINLIFLFDKRGLSEKYTYIDPFFIHVAPITRIWILITLEDDQILTLVKYFYT